MNQYPEPFNTFWQHAKKTHTRSSDNKHECYKEYQKHEREWLKDNEGKGAEDFAQYLINMIDIEQRHRAAMSKAGKRVDPRKAWVRWLKNYQYREEFEESIGQLQDKVNGHDLSCCVCGSQGSLNYMAPKGYFCESCDLEHNSIEAVNELRHWWKKANERVPKMQNESAREHHRRYVDKIRKEQNFMARLPYNKTRRTADEYGDYDEKELLQNWQTVEPDAEKEAEYRERYGITGG